MPPIRLVRDASFKGLFGPNTRYRYFADPASHPFRPGEGRYHPANAWWLAEASLLAYVPDLGYVARALGRAGMGLLDCIEQQRTDTRCLVAANTDTVWVLFRGTDPGSLPNLATDLDLVWQRQSGGRVHRGFWRALDGVWQSLADRLAALGPGRSVWLAGHSLGGALAALAAQRLGLRAGGLYTFGSPRVGDRALVAGIRCPAWRLVNSNDLVPRLPPRPYRAAGTLCYLDRYGSLHLRASLGLRFDDRWRGHGRHGQAVLGRWRGGDLRVVFNDELYDHAPIHYARLLRSLLFDESVVGV